MADALSRKHENDEKDEGMLAIISFPTPDWIEELKQSYSSSPELLELFINPNLSRKYQKAIHYNRG